MKREIKHQWIAALRSGKYTQGHCKLRSNVDQYCCLGVLCDIKDPKAWIDNGFHAKHYGKANENFPPGHVGRWAGLGCVDFEKLATMNDDGCSFFEIADYIENNL